MAKVLTSKAPGERVDYLWSPPLDAGDTITGSPTVTRISGSATLDSAAVVGPANLQVKLWFTLGTDGETSEFLAHVATTVGRQWEETLYLPVHTTALSALGAKLAQIFPAFAAVAPTLVDYWVDRAAAVVTWGDEHAQMLLACHYMTLNGLGTGTAAELAASGLSGVKSLKSGTLTVDFGDGAASGGKGDFNSTSYGRQFYPLLLARVAGARVTPSGVLDFEPRAY